MDELKLLTEMVAGLPAMALWVIAFFFAYKVICIGSIYGVIRLAINKMHDWLISPKRVETTVKDAFGNICITSDGTIRELEIQLSRIRGKNTGIDGSYIHTQSVRWLKEAIDDKIEKEKE